MRLLNYAQGYFVLEKNRKQKCGRLSSSTSRNAYYSVFLHIFEKKKTDCTALDSVGVALLQEVLSLVISESYPSKQRRTKIAAMYLKRARSTECNNEEPQK